MWGRQRAPAAAQRTQSLIYTLRCAPPQATQRVVRTPARAHGARERAGGGAAARPAAKVCQHRGSARGRGGAACGGCTHPPIHPQPVCPTWCAPSVRLCRLVASPRGGGASRAEGAAWEEHERAWASFLQAAQGAGAQHIPWPPSTEGGCHLDTRGRQGLVRETGLPLLS